MARKNYIEVLVDRIAYELEETLLVDANADDITTPKNIEYLSVVRRFYCEPINTKALDRPKTVPALFVFFEGSSRTDTAPGVNKNTNQEIEIVILRLQLALKDKVGAMSDLPDEAKTPLSQGTGFIQDMNKVLSNKVLRSTYHLGSLGEVYRGQNIDDIFPEYEDYSVHKARISQGFFTRIDARPDPIFNIQLAVILTLPYN